MPTLTTLILDAHSYRRDGCDFPNLSYLYWDSNPDSTAFETVASTVGLHRQCRFGSGQFLHGYRISLLQTTPTLGAEGPNVDPRSVPYTEDR